MWLSFDTITAATTLKAAPTGPQDELKSVFV
jgi:hypothetical protein